MSIPRSSLFIAFLLFFTSLMRAQPDSLVPNAKVTYTAIDVPGAIATDVFGINATGQMVGGYTAADGSENSFLLSGGKFTLFTYPGGETTSANAINDLGLIVGWAYVRQRTAAVSFLYDGTAFTTIRAPGASATIADGINNAGDVTGGAGTLAATKGFELVGSQFKNVSPQGTTFMCTRPGSTTRVRSWVGRQE